LGNGLAALGSFGASAHTSMVLAPTVSQRLGLAGLSCASCMCSAFELLSHHRSFENRLGIGVAIKAFNYLETLPSKPTRKALLDQCFGHTAVNVSCSISP